MIVVIADDLSGAAELAGAALTHGLRAEVQIIFTPETEADVICVDTDTRSRSSGEATQAVGRIAAQAAPSQPDWVYKKCDSVLRGHVLAEIRAIMRAMDLPRARLIPANPSRGRIIHNGHSFIHGQPLNETTFAHDPEFPRRTSNVAELLAGDLTGVTVPDATSAEDLALQAAKLESSVLPAGGVEFFAALLAERVSNTPRTPLNQTGEKSHGATLFVCGSAAAWASGRATQCQQHGVPVMLMPEELFAGEMEKPCIDTWTNEVADCLSKHSVAMAAIGRAALRSGIHPGLLAEHLAECAERVMEQVSVNRVCAEGGATAIALARRLGWTRFAVKRQLAGGVVELIPKPDERQSFIIKVGSYDWPEEIWPART